MIKNILQTMAPPQSSGDWGVWILLVALVVSIAFIISRIRKKNKESTVIQDYSHANLRQYKCFIAGSTYLQVERDAIRAAISELHNKWSLRGVAITSYTFEDFDKKVHVGGLQKLYNTFIQNEADCVIFIIDGSIGAQTLEEFKISFNSFKHRQKPSILVYSRNERKAHPQSDSFIDSLNQVKHYWRIYNDITSLKLMFKADIVDELIDLL